MNRRSLLIGVGVSLTAPFTGCLDSSTTEPEVAGSEDGNHNGSPLYDISLEVTDREIVGEFDVEASLEVVTETITDTSPAEIRVSFTNNESEPITVSSGPGWPFGVLTLSRDADGDDTVHIPFWSERYEESEHIPTDAENVTATDSIAVNEEVGGGKTVEADYELHSDAKQLEPGTYELTVDNALEDENRSGGHSLTATVEITGAN